MELTKGRVAAIGAAVAALIAAGVAAFVAWRSAVLGLRWFMAFVRAGRFAVRLGTLRAYRRCPECFAVRRREARVCARCGARLRK